MEDKQLILGSHVSMKAPHYFEGSVNQALSYGANALMIYTGPPQNSLRTKTDLLKIPEGLKIWTDAGFSSNHFVVHAPYIINLASGDSTKRAFGVSFLTAEANRCTAFGAKWLVLHPGSSVGTTPELAIKNLAESLNTVLAATKQTVICLETMAGKGNEIGTSFEQLRAIIKNVKQQKRIGVCLDTCHVNDAGYDLSNFDNVLNQFDKAIGLEKLHVVHFNDSLNPVGGHKDRHANLGYGTIGFDNLLKIAYHPKLRKIPLILETPYVFDEAPYGHEIKMLKTKKFTDVFPVLRK